MQINKGTQLWSYPRDYGLMGFLRMQFTVGSHCLALPLSGSTEGWVVLLLETLTPRS